MAQAYRTLERDESGLLRVVLREVGSDVVVTDPAGFSIVQLDEGRNPIPVNYWLDRPVDFDGNLPIPQATASPQSVDGLNPVGTQTAGVLTADEDRDNIAIDYFTRNEGRSSDTPTPVSQNAYNSDGTPNRFGEGIIDRGRGFLGAGIGAALGTAVAGPIGGLVGGLAARGVNRALEGRIGDRISPAGQLYGWGIGQPKPEAVIAEIDKERRQQAPAATGTPTTGQTQNRASSPATQSVDGLNPSRSPVPSYNDLMNAPVGQVSRTSLSPVGTSTAPQSVGRTSAGTQLEDITGKANVTYDLDGKNRPHRPDLEVVDRVSTAVGTALPGYTVNVTSGLGEFGSDRHRAVNQGRALDFTLTDPAGQRVTPTSHPAEFQSAASALASYGIKGIGHYGWGMHADTVRENAWGPTTGLASLNPSFGRAIEQGRANPAAYSYSGPPTPTARPDLTTPTSSPAVASTGRANFNNMTMGEIAFSGFGKRPDDTQIEAMGRVMAGELSPRTLEGLRAGDPEARREAANVVATMENRRQSVGFANITNPSQYNSMMGSNLRTTDANFSKYGSVLTDTIRDTYAGRNAPSNPNATHYANMDIANPSWGRSMTNVEKVGAHTFGTIPGEYQAPQDRLAQARANAEASRRSYEDSRATPAQDVSPRTAVTNPSSGIGLGVGGFASLSLSGGLAGKTERDAKQETSSTKDTNSYAERNDRDKDTKSGSSSRDSTSSREGSGSGLGSRDSTPSGRSSSSSRESSGSGSGGLGSRSSGGVTPGAERSGSSLNSSSSSKGMSSNSTGSSKGSTSSGSSKGSSSSSSSSSRDNDKDKPSNASDGSSRGGGRRT